MQPDQYTKTPNGDFFVKSHVHKGYFISFSFFWFLEVAIKSNRINRSPGMLTEILSELLAARKAAKREMESCTDPFVYAVLNGIEIVN